jgi:DNA-binding LacI/PurR family transcriptional regulator
MAARSLRTDQTNTIGIIVDDLLSPFVPSIVRGIQDYLKQHDYMTLSVNSDWDPDTEKDAINTLISRPVDGLIFVESPHLAVNEALIRSGKRFVFAHRLFGGATTNSVVPDDHYGASLAVKHLIALGHRRIAYISGPEGWHTSRQRLSGYKDTMAEHNLPLDPSLVQVGDWDGEGGYAAAMNLLALPERPTAIFSANDAMAVGAISAVYDQGLNVPKDVAIVGYDNRDFARIIRPKLTTVSMPVYEMGLTAAELLLQLMREEQQELPEVKVKGQLFVRETCGADISQRTQENLNTEIMTRRVLLRKDPDE